MIINTENGRTFYTETDLTAPERHILQKLFLWKSMASSVQQFREKKNEALRKGWNNSGPIAENTVLKIIVSDLEKMVALRLNTGKK
ncbi:MAG: hypothetical protein JRJ85_05000 [Deltaproteobacteria bacterium]|nr:hypothetical protein [Deltaproteobacteria bacterium]